MRRRRMDRILLGISVGCFLAMSVSFLLIPIESIKLLPGLLFWLGLVLGTALQILLETRRRAFFRKNGIDRKKTQKRSCGLFSFFSNIPAAIADICLVLSLAAAVCVFIVTKGYSYVCCIMLATTVFSFCMHCICNGRLYFHATNAYKVRRMPAQSKAKNLDKGEGEK